VIGNSPHATRMQDIHHSSKFSILAKIIDKVNAKRDNVLWNHSGDLICSIGLMEQPSRKHDRRRVSHIPPLSLWLYSPLDLAGFQFLNLYAVGRTVWTGDQPAGQHKHRIAAHRHPFLHWDSNPRSQCLRPCGHCDLRPVTPLHTKLCSVSVSNVKRQISYTEGDNNACIYIYVYIYIYIQRKNS
jgi:hypothetical protein